MIEVKITDKLNFEKAIKVFRKQCQKDGFLMDMKEKRYYTKPSEQEDVKAQKIDDEKNLKTLKTQIFSKKTDNG
jgi:ribosomal protein S21